MAHPILNIVSWNTNGLKSKITLVLLKLEACETDIAFLQETHIGRQCTDVLEDIDGWRVFFTVHKSDSKGVAILIRNHVPFEYICHDEDYCGGYIVLFCRLYGELYTLVNVYNHKEDKRVLGRLKDYLMETAEGVLLIGGDFNTVFNPTFDRRLSTTISPLKVYLEDFTTSLKLKDMWAYHHYKFEGFTYHQNDSFSRLDMLFTVEETIERVSEIEVGDSLLKKEELSKHKRVVIKFKVQPQTENTTPQVASSLNNFIYTTDSTVGKINGAEILCAIKSFTDIGEYRPGEQDLAYYKKHRCSMTEELKVVYNQILKSNMIPEQLKTHHHVGDRYIFSCKYLIFLQILAARLSELSTTFLKRQTKRMSNNILFTVIIKRGPQEIRESFLKENISCMSLINTADTNMFSILWNILPEAENTVGFRVLRNGCPLTKPILDMVLQVLQFRLNVYLTTSVCFQRQALRTSGEPSKHQWALEHTEKFIKNSGVKMEILE